jgi:hypothetical protein
MSDIPYRNGPRCVGVMETPTSRATARTRPCAANGELLPCGSASNSTGEFKVFNGGGYRLRGSVAFAFNALSLSLSGSASIDPLESIIVVDTLSVRNLVPLVEGMPSLDLARRCCSSLLPGELIKQAKGRILLDLYTLSTWSPQSLQTVGTMLTATSKSLSVSEVCHGTEFGFPWLNTILGGPLWNSARWPASASAICSMPPARRSIASSK